MNHLESSFTGKNRLWRYVVMFVSVLIVSNTIGAIPLIIVYSIKAASDPSIISAISSNPGNPAALGLDPNIGLILMLFPFMAGLAAFFFLIRPLNGRTFSLTINGTNKFRWNRFFISSLIWLILSAAYLIIYLKIDPTNFSLNYTKGTLFFLILVSLLLVPFQAAFEEVLFRGYLMQGFACLFKNRWLPLFTTSLLFGLMHSFNPEVDEFGFFTMMPQYFLFGLVFGLITILDDGIEAAIGAHTSNNVFLCIMLTHESSALQTQAVYKQHTIYPWTEFGALLISGIVFVIILKFVFKWENFSSLLGRIKKNEPSVQDPYTDVLSSLR